MKARQWSRLAAAEQILDVLEPRQSRLILRQMFRLVPRSRRADLPFTLASRVLRETPSDVIEGRRVNRRVMAMIRRRERSAQKGSSR